MADIMTLEEICANMREWTRAYFRKLHPENSPGLAIVFSTRLEKRPAHCRRYNATGAYRITYSVPFIKANIEDTFLLKGICGHEVAHTKVMGHGAAFKRVCVTVLGLDPAFARARLKLDCAVPEGSGRWILTCPKCGFRMRRRMAPRPGQSFTHIPCGTMAQMTVTYDDRIHR